MIKHRMLLVLAALTMVLLLPVSGCSNPLQRNDPTAAPATTVQRPSNQDTVTAEGVVIPFEQADLSFLGSGRVERILVSEGDQVLGGQQLAVLETRDLEQAVLRAQARLDASQAQLAKAQAGALPEEIAAAEAGLAVAQAAGTAASGAVAIAQGKFTGADADLKAAKDAITVAESRLASAKAAYQAALAAYNKLLAQPTARDIEIAQKQVESAKNNLYDTQLMLKIGQAYMGQDAQLEVEVQIAELNLMRVKAGARPEDKSEARAGMAQASANVAVCEAQVAQARAFAAQAQAGVGAAQGGVTQAQAEADRTDAQALQAQAQVDMSKAGSRTEDIAALQAQVKLDQASLTEAQNTLEDAQLRAPFDGTVGAVLVEEGDLAGPQLVALQLGDLSRLRVETKNLSEMDISRVEVGQSAVITVDALGGKQIPATVASISPVATLERGDTVYRVTLDLEPGAEAGLRWGMSTLTEIKAGDPLSLPSQAEVQIAGDDVVSAQAILVPHKSADLSFKSSGRVAEVFVSEGDLVVAGQDLIRLDARSLEQTILQAQAGLAQAEANLAKVQAGARPEEIRSSEAAVTIAEAAVRAAQGAVVVAQGQLAAARANVDAAQAGTEMAEGQVSAMEGAWNAAKARLDKARNGATAIDLAIALKQVDLARAEYRIVELMKDVARNFLVGKLAALQNMIEIAQLQYEQLEAGTPAEDIAAAQADVTKTWSDVQAAKAQVSQAQAQEQVAQAGVQTAEAQVSQAETQVAMAQAQVEQAKAQLNALKAASRPEDVAAAAAQVSQAKASLAAAQNALDDVTLKALFDGTVGSVLVDKGELVQPARVVIQLGDLSRLRAETEDLSEVDVSRIQVGQQAAVTVDALDGQMLPGTVYRVAQLATERRGDTVYKISLELDATPDGNLRWGMSAWVEIDTATDVQVASANATRLAQNGSALPATSELPTPTPEPTSSPTQPTTPTPLPTATPTVAPSDTPAPSPSSAATQAPALATTTPLPPTATPTPTRTPTATPTHTPTRAATATPRPTQRPVRTSTPAPYLPAPGLDAPPDNATFFRNDRFELEWFAVPGMPADAFYAITVSYMHWGETWYDDIPWTKQISWMMSDHGYLVDLSDDTEFRWYVQVMRKTGEDPNGKPIGIPLSPKSHISRIYWLRSSRGGGNTPPPPTP